MKNLIIKILVTIGFISFFKGTSKQFKVAAKEGSEKSANVCDISGGGRTGACGNSV